MKKATVTAFTATVRCPYCKEDVPEPNTSSLYWSREELTVGKQVECEHCLMSFVIPERIRGVKIT